ncbi:lipopolysaccharide biosynthesis protein [Thermodesulfobacteriota bacterium B35]
MSVFRRNVLSNAGATAIGSLTQLALVAILSRLLDIASFATYISAVAFIGVFEIASDFGTRVWATREFSITAQGSDILLPAIGSKLLYSGIFTLFVLWVPLQNLTFVDTILCLLIASLQPPTDPLLWYLRGRERLDLEAIFTLYSRVGGAMVIALFVFLGCSVTTGLAGWIIVILSRIMLETCTPEVKSLLATTRIASWSLAKLKSVAINAFPVGLAFLLMAFYQRLGVLSLGQLSDATDVAMYGAAFTLTAPAGFLAVSITAASFPSLSRAMAAAKYQEVRRIVQRKIFIISAVFFPLCALGILLAPWALPLFYGNRFQASATIMMLLLPGLYISTVNFALKYVLNAARRNWADAGSALVGVVVFLLMIIVPFNKQLSLVAGVAWGVGELAIFVIKVAVLARYSKIPVSFIPYVISMLTLLAILSGYCVSRV